MEPIVCMIGIGMMGIIVLCWWGMYRLGDRQQGDG